MGCVMVILRDSVQFMPARGSDTQLLSRSLTMMLLSRSLTMIADGVDCKHSMSADLHTCIVMSVSCLEFPFFTDTPWNFYIMGWVWDGCVMCV
jgi:hypothetical protein